MSKFTRIFSKAWIFLTLIFASLMLYKSGIKVWSARKAENTRHPPGAEGMRNGAQIYFTSGSTRIDVRKMLGLPDMVDENTKQDWYLLSINEVTGLGLPSQKVVYLRITYLNNYVSRVEDLLIDSFRKIDVDVPRGGSQ